MSLLKCFTCFLQNGDEEEQQSVIRQLFFGTRSLPLNFCNLFSTDSKTKRLNTMSTERQQKLVFGYTRRIEGEDKRIIIPSGISLIILKYHDNSDKWNLDLKSKDLILSDDNRTVHHVNAYSSGNTSWRSVYGTDVCTAGLYEWSFKISKIIPNSGRDNSWKILIGIVKVKENENKLEQCWNRTPTNGYGFIGSRSYLNKAAQPYGEKFENEGDEMTMYLDMRRLTLSYTINGTAYGKAFDVAAGSYRMALSVCDGRYITLL